MTGPAAPPDLTDATDATYAAIQEAFIALVRFANRPATHQALRDAAGVELDRSTYAIVARIVEFEPIRPRDLAAELGVDTSTMSRQLARLVALGYVERVEDPTDGRAHLLRIRPAGRELRDRFRGVWNRWLAQALAEWPASDRDALAELLDRFVRDLRATPVRP